MPSPVLKEPCFWCGIAFATHQLDHATFGPRPACDTCDPREPENTGDARAVARMAAVLLGTARRGEIDLADERQVHGRLVSAGFKDASIAAFGERATEEARAAGQDHDHGLRQSIERFGSAAAVTLMFGAWLGLCWTILQPDPLPSRPVAFVQVRR